MAEPTVEQRARRLCHDLRWALGCDIHPRAYGLILAALRGPSQTGGDAERARAALVRAVEALPSHFFDRALTHEIVENLVPDIIAALRDAERRGAEAMREAAAQLCENHVESQTSRSSETSLHLTQKRAAYAEGILNGRAYAAGIRALPLRSPTTPKETK
jgi:hypothetical protein